MLYKTCLDISSFRARYGSHAGRIRLIGASIRHAFRKYAAVGNLSFFWQQRKGTRLKGTVVIAGGRYLATGIYNETLARCFPTSLAELYTALAYVPQLEDVGIIEPDDGAMEERLVERREGLEVHTCTRKRIMQNFGQHSTSVPLPAPSTTYASFNRNLPTVYATGLESLVSGFRTPRYYFGELYIILFELVRYVNNRRLHISEGYNMTPTSRPSKGTLVSFAS